ncbi:MAG: flavodoxin [Selenomonas sp.]|nr:flavodoxin [Selenomonas sp.]
MKQASTDAGSGKAAGKMLIAYYSLTGTTRAAAKKIQSLTGADIFEIPAADPYPTAHDPCLERQMKEIAADARPALARKVENIASYDTIFIGYPIWYYQAPMLLNTFVEQQDLFQKTIMPFCTSGGYGIERSVDILRALMPNAYWKDGLRVAGDDKELRDWLRQLG